MCSPDRQEMELWKSDFFGRALKIMDVIKDSQATAIKQMITTRGAEWVTTVLLPAAIEKNMRRSLTFTLSLIMLVLHPTKALSDTERAQAFAALAPSTITEITVATGAFEDDHGLAMFRSGLIAAQLHDELERLQDRVLVEYGESLPKHNRALLKFLKAISPGIVVTGHTAWFRKLVLAYVLRVVGYEPELPRTWTKPSKGCGCEMCKEVDLFLVDPIRRTAVFARNLPVRKHVAERFGARYFDSRTMTNKDGEFTLKTIAERSPHGLEITKNHDTYRRQHAEWKNRANKERQSLRSLGPTPHLQALLGSRWEDIVMLKFVTLRRDASGATPGTYQTPVPAVDESTTFTSTQSRPQNVLTTGNANSQESHTPSTVVGTKRPAPDAAENQDPAKRVAIEVIDLT